VASAADKGEAAAGVADLRAPRRRRAATGTRRKPPPPDRFLNRELSWLDWNERCIQLGGFSKTNAGTLTISSTGAPAPVVVPAGKCLTGGATVPAGAHPILGAFQVVDCN